MCAARLPRDRRGPPRRVEQARQEQAPGDRWIKDVRCSLLKAPENQTKSCSAAGEVRPPTRGCSARRCSRASSAALQGTRPRPGPRAPGRLARVGITIATQTVPQARPHDPQIQRRDARRDRARDQQRPAGGAKHQGQTDQSPRYGFHAAEALIRMIYLCAGESPSTYRSPPTREESPLSGPISPVGAARSAAEWSAAFLRTEARP